MDKTSLILIFLTLCFFFFSSFKLFLELEPQVRDIIFKFYESKYASCLKMLDEMKVSLLMCVPLLSLDLAEFQTLILSVISLVEIVIHVFYS